MLYQIEFLPVGKGEKSGDAICLRYSLDNGLNWVVGVIDGGDQDSGEAIVAHVRGFYNVDHIDFVLCTHPDKDHSSGLAVVLEQMSVGLLLMHCPWECAEHIFDRVNDGRTTLESLRKKLIDGHPHAFNLYQIAVRNRIPLHRPYSNIDGPGIPCLTILGPSVDYYLEKLINFRSITGVTEDGSHLFDLADRGMVRGIIERAVNWVAENWDVETLVDPAPNDTSSENSSSVITHFNFGGEYALFTGDAGVEALSLAADRMEQLQLPLQNFFFFQAPHHGSKRNLGPSVLNRLVGHPRGVLDRQANFTSYISAAPEGEPKHPNKRVVNALKRRGAQVYCTKRVVISHNSNGIGNRQGWIDAEELPFYSHVEND